MQDENRKFYEDFGIRIRFLRKRRGLTLQDLAGKSSTAKSWEDGTMPSADKWEDVASRLGLSVSFVFLGAPRTASDFDFIAKFADELPQQPGEGVIMVPHHSPDSLPDALLISQARQTLQEAIDLAKGDSAALGWIVTELRSLKMSLGKLQGPPRTNPASSEVKTTFSATP